MRRVAVGLITVLLACGARETRLGRNDEPPRMERVDLANTWILGWELGTAAFAAADHPGDPLVEETLGRCRFIGESLGVRVPTLPRSGDDIADRRAAALYYLVEGTLPGIRDILQTRYSQQHSDLFSFGLASAVALALYVPGDQRSADLMRKMGPKTRLPEEIWSPPLHAMEHGVTYEATLELFVSLDRRIRMHLMRR